MKVLPKEASDPGSGIELRGTREAVSLPPVDLDLRRGGLLPQQTLYCVSMGSGEDSIRSAVEDQAVGRCGEIRRDLVNVGGDGGPHLMQNVQRF